MTPVLGREGFFALIVLQQGRNFAHAQSRLCILDAHISSPFLYRF
jgi:hypothetical protein